MLPSLPRVLLLAVLLLLTSMSTGCLRYYRVESTLTDAFTIDDKPHVSTSPSGAALGASIRTVAVRPPSECANIRAGTFMGGGQPADELLNTQCGVLMGELERAFAREGYRVIFWDAVLRERDARRLAAEQTRHERQLAYGAMNTTKKSEDPANLSSLPEAPRPELTEEEAAKAMGVDAFVTVHSLDTSVLSLTEKAQWTRKYHKADKYGEDLGATSVSPRLGDALDHFVRAYEHAAFDRESVSIHLSVQHLSSNESIFFYDRVQVRLDEEDYKKNLYVACDTRWTFQDFWFARYWVCNDGKPRAHGSDDRPDRDGSEAGNANATDARRQSGYYWSSLIRGMAEDIALRFRRGPDAKPAAPTAPAAPGVAPAAPIPVAPTAPPGAPAAGGEAPPAWMNK